MAMITKAEVATVLGILATAIPDSVYTWATKQFFITTGLKEISTSFTHRKFIGTSTVWIKLPHKNISTITSLTIDGTSVDIVIDTNVKINEDTGLMTYTGGFGGGQKVVVVGTIAAYTHTDIHDYLITLFVLKGLVLFTPQEVNSAIKKITIGRYSKTFGAVDSTLEGYTRSLGAEINEVKKLILGDDGSLQTGAIQ